jgi:glycosyltransferase involved in cell wall biosynthesis
MKSHFNTPKALYADVTRLLRRHVGSIHHTGIDRVNLEYARWIHGLGGGLCLRHSGGLKVLSRAAWGRYLLGIRQPGNPGRRRRERLLLLLRSLILRKPIPSGSMPVASTHSWLAHGEMWDWLRLRECRPVVFIHDLIPIEYPEFSHPREKALHERRLENSLRHSRGIVVNSQCTESAVKRFARRAGLPVPPIQVAPLGHDLPQRGVESLPNEIRKPYFLVLGTIEPRKNHLLLLTLWRELARRHGESTPQLVVVGRRGWECEQVVDLLERCEAIHPYLVERNNATDSEVATLVSQAHALLMPSFAEGFGIPVLEALSLGTPVISSPLPAIREFAGDIPDYAEPFDGTRWLELIESHLDENSPVRLAQLRRLHAFRDTTWPEHFRLVGEFLDSLE